MKVLFIRSHNSGLDAISSRQGNSLQKQGVNIVYYNIVGKGAKGYFKNLVNLKRSIKNEKPDLLHAHYSLSGLLTTLTLTRVPIVVSLMGSDVLAAGKPMLFIVRFCARFLWKHTIVKSKEIYDCLSLKKAATIIPNGVNMEVFRPSPQEAARKALGWNPGHRHVLFGSSPKRPEKNFALSLEAVNKVKIEHPNTDFHFLENLEQEAVVMHYNAADLLLLTSVYEGSPNVIKEAMACNCPIVATNVGDIAAVTKNTDQVILVPFDAVKVSEAIATILSTNRRSNGRENIEPLNSADIAEKIIGIYKNVLSGK